MNEKVDFVESWEHNDRFIIVLVNAFFLEVSEVGKSKLRTAGTLNFDSSTRYWQV